MPKSKRSRAVALTQTDKRATRQHKQDFIDEVRQAIGEYESVYVFSFPNMRSSHFKDVRLAFRKTSRIFLGKNKLMQLALGRTPEDEQSDNLRHVSKHLTGPHVGLLCTSMPDAEVQEFFQKFQKEDYARGGDVAPREVQVSDLEQFPVSMMEQLRKLGMPVAIKDGKIMFRDNEANYRICKQGEKLSVEKCKLLVHFKVQLVDFSVSLLCRWSKGAFEEFDTAMKD